MIGADTNEDVIDSCRIFHHLGDIVTLPSSAS